MTTDNQNFVSITLTYWVPQSVVWHFSVVVKLDKCKMFLRKTTKIHLNEHISLGNAENCWENSNKFISWDVEQQTNTVAFRIRNAAATASAPIVVVSYTIFGDVLMRFSKTLKQSRWSRVLQFPFVNSIIFFGLLLLCWFACMWMCLLYYANCSPPLVHRKMHENENLKLKINKRCNELVPRYRTSTRCAVHCYKRGYNLLVNIILWNVASILIERPRMTLFHHSVSPPLFCRRRRCLCCCCSSATWISHFHILTMCTMHTTHNEVLLCVKSLTFVEWWWRCYCC